MKEILNTSLLVSLHHSTGDSANMEIFDISRKGKARKLYSFEEVVGGNTNLILINFFATKLLY